MSAIIMLTVLLLSVCIITVIAEFICAAIDSRCPQSRHGMHKTEMLLSVGSKLSVTPVYSVQTVLDGCLCSTELVIASLQRHRQTK